MTDTKEDKNPTLYEDENYLVIGPGEDEEDGVITLVILARGVSLTFLPEDWQQFLAAMWSIKARQVP